MKSEQKPKKKWTAFLLFVLALVVLLNSSFMQCYWGLIEGYLHIDPISQIRRYARDRETLTFDDVLGFDWDIAYYDEQVYGKSENIKDMTGLDFHINELSRDHLRRILFFKNNRLVKVAWYTIEYASIYGIGASGRAGGYEEKLLLSTGEEILVLTDTIIILPSTEFRVDWNGEHLNLINADNILSD